MAPSPPSRRRRAAAALPLALALALALAACTSTTSAPSAAAPSPGAASTSSAPPRSAPSAGAPTTRTPSGVEPVRPGAPEVLATGLEAPWGLAFLPDGSALVTERDTARVLRVPVGGGEPVEVARVAEAAPAGEGGLLGLAVGPTYAADRWVHAYVTTAEDNRVVRFRLPDQPGPAATEPVLTGIPKGVIHNGGRLAFGPDGALYAGTGDTGDTSLARDPDSLGGKVLRMTPVGEPVRGADSVVLSVGHRNVQGLAFDDDERLWATEFGQSTYDEVNQVSEGDDGGWPEVEGPGDGGGRFAEPAVTWSTSEASPSGLAVAAGSLWVAALRGERLWQVPLDGAGGAGTPVARLEGEFGRLRAAETAPDGALWLLTSNRDGRGDPEDDDDRVLRLTLDRSPNGT